MSDRDEQERVCRAHDVSPDTPAPTQMAGVALATLSRLPLNGLRHAAEAGTCGWYIWGGTDFPEDSEFFQPVHVAHLGDHCPAALPFLALPPGWRFLVADEYVDVWQDSKLLNVGDSTLAG
jgi:hypothetical protein